MHKAIVALDRMKAKLDAVERSRAEPIAIIGMGCRFPGGADSPEAFFRLLEAGVDAVTQVPETRWQLDTSKDADASPERRAMRWGAFLREPVDRFDARFFGISPREAAHLDPQQRLLLEVAWEALERAGLDPARLVGSTTGVFVGITTDDYADLCRASGPEGEDIYSATGNGHCFAPGRLSYTFGFQGPSLAVDTACSSSLVAVHLACQSLRAGEATMAIAGGVNLMLSPDTTRLTATTQGLSPDGRCKAFDAAASGFVRGEGCGLVVLKRLSDAQRDGDRILALIRGSAVNQDGRSTGLTAPNVLSQQAMLRQALASARVQPEEIDYVEAHGTGTALGDPIELEALRAVLGKPRADGSTCVLGAAKSNIGHLEAAAGIAGLIKAVMALQRESIPGNLHFRTLNPRISLEGTPFVIPTASLPWKRGTRARIAGVSAFGMSGTNAHVIVEEPLRDRLDEPLEPVSGSYLLPISARSLEALRAHVEAYAALLVRADAPRITDLVAAASLRRTHHEHRLAVLGRTRDEMAGALGVLVRNGTAGGVAQGRVATTGRPRVVFVFPGQGSQWLGMGRQLFAEEPAFRAAIEKCDEVIRRQGSFSVIDELIVDEKRSRLGHIDVVQPMLFAIQVALAALWRSWGIEPDVVVGHSLGEVAAARVAGVLGLEDAAKIICRRSRLLRRVSGKGAMALVELPRAEAALAIAGYEDRLGVAVSNGPQSTVISGDPAALAEVLRALEAREIFCRNVKVDVASHSPQMDPLRDDLLATLRNVRPRPARIAMRSTVTGETVRGPELDAAYWVRNLREPVLFLDATQRLIAEGHTVFVEISPHPILVPSVEENLHEKRRDGAVIASLRRNTDERRTMLEALGALYARGHAVDWTRVYARESRAVELPTYPWQRERHWVRGPALTGSAPPRRSPPEPLEAATFEPREGWLWEPSWRRHDRVAAAITPPVGGWLVLGDHGGVGEALTRRLRAAGATCVRAIIGATLRRIEPGLWEIDPADPDAYLALLRDAFPATTPCHGVVHLFGLDAPPSERTTIEALTRAQRLGSESALLVAQALLRADFASAPGLWIVTRGAVAVARRDDLAVAQAPLWGLGRTLQAEHPELACKLIDLGVELADAAIDALLADLAPGDREDQIALRSTGRFVARLVPHARSLAAATKARLHADASYLVTGGLGGLGLAVAGWLIEQGAHHLALVGRGAPSDAARAAITRLEAAGATVLVVAADVSRRGDVDALLARIDAALPPLRGVVHAAGLLQDRTVLDLSIASMRSVAAPKVQGAWNLHQATLARALDFFVMYGSAASLLGSPGQANYAAASAFLDALAHHRRARGLPGLALDWGPFSHVGLAMLQTNRGDRLASMGFRSLTPAEGHAVLGALLGGDLAQIGVLPMDAERAVASMPHLTTSPYFAELVRTASRELREPAPTSLSRGALRSASPADQRARLARLVTDSLAHVLRLDRAQIDRAAPFHGYGFDSLMGLELRNRLQTALDLQLSMADIITHARVDALAQLLAERLALVAATPVSRRSLAHAVAVAPMALFKASAPGNWIVIPRPVAEARMRLFCFPYAGGSASIFATWPAGLPPEIEVCAIQPPGRHERLHEPLLHSVDAMVAALVPAMLPHLDRPFAVFGHCLGAIVMFEALRRLADLHGKKPVHVFASGAPAPRRYLVPSLAARPHEEFLALLGAIGFARAGVLEDEDAERHLLPAVKADFELAARYVHAPSLPLSAPITVFAGQDDSFAPINIVDEWRHETTSWSEKVVFPGEHYFIVREREAVLGIVGEELLLRLAAIEQHRRSPRADRSSPARSTPRARLFCFPGLGQSSSIPEDWQSALSNDDVQVCPIELPGRGARADELPLGRVDEIVDHLSPLLRGRLDVPFAFFGLDLGAIVMFELTRRLRREGAALPGHLFVGAAMAPHVHYFASLQYLPRERLFASLRLQGLSFDASVSTERALRAECAALTSYAFVDEPRLELPITAFLGERDVFIPRGGVRAWSEQTTATFEMHVGAGAHDLRCSEPDALLAILRATLSQSPFR